MIFFPPWIGINRFFFFFKDYPRIAVGVLMWIKLRTFELLSTDPAKGDDAELLWLSPVDTISFNLSADDSTHQVKKRRHDVCHTQAELYSYVQDPAYCEGSSINVVSPWSYSFAFLFGREIAGLDGIAE
ncbi:hypothetical protein BofuT4_P066560.1 [Botrytis cinerea T4]|uniref:Uncharacterized protein n=1 Tax=Botryotinia fuckeliana (strain T4) TaxID=999810 RepID=G2XRN5_BOTF4|nr:hypothetical protein BofuT4_P066560.1 [Botrytis cinerea T4]